jgi:hypothetical protein
MPSPTPSAPRRALPRIDPRAFWRDFFAHRLPIYLLVLVGATIAAIYLFFHFELSTPRPVISWEGGRSIRQLAVLEAYASRAEQGSLLPPGDAVIAVREEFVEEAVRRSLPLRQEFEDGRYLARLDTAFVRLESGMAVVTLAGRGVLGTEPDAPIYADLQMQGLIVVENLDPEDGSLRARILITDVRVRRAGAMQIRALVHPVVRYFSRLQIADWNAQRRPVVIPVRVENEIQLPPVEGDVRIAGTRVPFAVRVSAVTTLARRMVLSLTLEPDTLGGEAPLRASAWIEPAASVQVHTREWGRRLRKSGLVEEELATLRARVDSLAAADPMWNAVVEEDRDLVAVVPASILRTLTARVSRRYLRGVRIDFAPELTEDIDQQIRARLLGARVGVGRVRGQVHIDRLSGALTVRGAPQVRLVPPNEMVVDVPVQLVRGSGRIRLDVEWDPALLVGALCRSFSFEEVLVGEVKPMRHELTTRIRFAVYDSVIAGRPRVDRDRISLSTDLTDASWSKVQEALEQQDRFSRCGIAMDPKSVMEKLYAVGRRGIKIRLPERIFKPFRVPVVLDDEYETGGYRIEARAYDPEIHIERDYLRFALNADLRVRADTTRAPSVTPPGTATPGAGGTGPPALP